MSASKSLSPAPESEPPAAEDVLPVDRKPDRPHRQQRERDGRHREPDDVPRLPVRGARTHRGGDRVDEEPAEPEDEQPVERAAEEGPERRRSGRRSSGRRAAGRRARSRGSPAIPARMTIAMIGSCRASAASSESSRSAANVPRGLVENRERAQPPLLLERPGRLHGGTHAASVLSAACLKPPSSSRCPEAEPLVSAWRAQHDWSAQRGVPAHITILYPFVPTEKVDEGLLTQLRELFAAEPAISFELPAWPAFPRSRGWHPSRRSRSRP